MSELLMAAWDGAGATPPLMSVARSLVARGHHVRVLADPVLRRDVEAAGAVHVPWTRAPHRATRSLETLFIPDWVDGFPAMRDNLAVGPAAAFAADVREELERRPAAAVLTEALLFGPLVAAEAAGVPSVILNTTINTVPARASRPSGPASSPLRRTRSASVTGRWRARRCGCGTGRSRRSTPPATSTGYHPSTTWWTRSAAPPSSSS